MPNRRRIVRNLALHRVSQAPSSSSETSANGLFVSVDRYLRTHDARLRGLRDTEVQERLQ